MLQALAAMKWDLCTTTIDRPETQGSGVYSCRYISQGNESAPARRDTTCGVIQYSLDAIDDSGLLLLQELET